MKTGFAMLLAASSLAASAQDGTLSAAYKGISGQLIKVEPKWVNKDLGSGFAFGLRSSDSSIFVQLLIFPAFNGFMNADDPLVFTLANDSAVVASSRGMQLRSRNYREPYEYQISLEDVRKLQQIPAIGLRIYSAGSYKDNVINGAARLDIQEVCAAFLQAYERRQSAIN
jgi:hypothetical protein